MAASIVYEGQMFKQGKWSRSWISRWFVLRNNRRLANYKDQKESMKLNPISEIHLDQIEDIINDRSKDVQNKYVFELTTSTERIYCLACIDMQSANAWEKHLHAFIFGQQIHTGWLWKYANTDNVQSWERRWFTLSKFKGSPSKQLKYYEDDTQKKCKGVINLNNVLILRHCHKRQYEYQNAIELVTHTQKLVLACSDEETIKLWRKYLREMVGPPMNVLYSTMNIEFLLRKVKNKHKLLISGYLKQCQLAMDLHIPNEIANFIIINGYLLSTQWIRRGKWIIDQTKFIAIRQSSEIESIIYANPCVSKGKHYWKVKIDHNNNGCYIGIIFSEDSSYIYRRSRCSLFHRRNYGVQGYAYHTKGYLMNHKMSSAAIWSPDGISTACNHGDIITVHLDLELKSIGFSRNDKWMGTAFTDIDNTKSYRLALSVIGIHDKDFQFELLP